MKRFNGEAVSIRATEGDEVTDIRVRQGRSYPAGLAEGTFDIIGSSLRTRDAERTFSFSVNPIEPEHAGTVFLPELFMVGRVLKLKPHGFYARSLIVTSDDFHDGRLVDVFLHALDIFCHECNVDIFCNVSVIPMSTGHCREHRPHPLQLLTLNLPGK